MLVQAHTKHVETFDWSTQQYTIWTGRVKTCTRMDSTAIRNLCIIVFKEPIDGSSKCKFCDTCCITTQEKILHIFHNHHQFWETAISKFSWIMEKLWIACFKHSINMYKCRHCIEEFCTEDRRVLHKHMKSKHPILLLGYSILYNEMCQ